MQIPSFWYKKNLISFLLYPLSLLFLVIIKLRYYLLKKQSISSKTKIIVIGNISVGGNGKTPSIISLAKEFRKLNKKVGIISRGYGGENAKNKDKVVEVFSDSDFKIVGDEALMMAQKLLDDSFHIPIAVSRNRLLAAKTLLNKYPNLDFIFSDDGLQHYKLPRDYEFALISADFKLGNKFLLPAGALREPVSRLNKVSGIIVTNTTDDYAEHFAENIPHFYLRADKLDFYFLHNREKVQLDDLINKNDDYGIISSIARPKRVVKSLENHGIKIKYQLFFADHADLSQENIIASIINFAKKSKYIFISEKDAVKTQAWSNALKEKTIVCEYNFIIPDELLKFIIANQK